MLYTESAQAVNPQHYRGKVQAIELCEQLGYCLGNAIKYIWRCGEKPYDGSLQKGLIVDLDKAEWYLTRLQQLEGESKVVPRDVTKIHQFFDAHSSFTNDDWKDTTIREIVEHYVFGTLTECDVKISLEALRLHLENKLREQEKL